MPAADYIGFDADLEFLRQTLEARVAGKMPMQTSCKGFKCRKALNALTAAGNAAHRTAAGAA